MTEPTPDGRPRRQPRGARARRHRRRAGASRGHRRLPVRGVRPAHQLGSSHRRPTRRRTGALIARDRRRPGAHRVHGLAADHRRRSWTPARTCASSASWRATGSRDRIDTEAAWERGMRTVDTTNGSSYGVSEWALALMASSACATPASGSGIVIDRQAQFYPASLGGAAVPPGRADGQDRRAHRLRHHRPAAAGAPGALPLHHLRPRPVRAARARGHLRRDVHEPRQRAVACRTWSSAWRPSRPPRGACWVPASSA